MSVFSGWDLGNLAEVSGTVDSHAVCMCVCGGGGVAVIVSVCVHAAVKYTTLGVCVCACGGKM